eukprot:m.58139 g.58139  ORF g.58139 m.58139 type:complete len:325 (-) comp17194_c0_seq1:143-1117(-)
MDSTMDSTMAEMEAFEEDAGGGYAASQLIGPPVNLSEPDIAHSHVYEDFEVKGELRIGTTQCALIGRLYQQDMYPPPKAWAKANPDRDIHTLHGVADIISTCEAAGQTCVRYQYRVMPDQSHGLSLFHAYIRWEDGDFYITLNQKHSGPDAAHFKLRKVWFIDPVSHRSNSARDLFGTISSTGDIDGNDVMVQDGPRQRKRVVLDRSESRLRAKLVDGDILQIGNDSVNRLRITIYKGELGDGVPSYLHVREEPDPRHIPIMMKLWELTERMEVLQSSVDSILVAMGADAPVSPSRAAEPAATSATNVEESTQEEEYLQIGGDL